MSDRNEKQDYIDAWTAIFAGLKGWSESRVLEWVRATNKDACLSDPAGMIYHESPLYWAVDALIPATLSAKLSKMQQIDLRAEILDFLVRVDPSEFSVGVDWKLHQQELQSILNKWLGVSVESRRKKQPVAGVE